MEPNLCFLAVGSLWFLCRKTNETWQIEILERSADAKISWEKKKGMWGMCESLGSLTVFFFPTSLFRAVLCPEAGITVDWNLKSMKHWSEVWIGYCCCSASLAFDWWTITSGWNRETNDLTNPPTPRSHCTFQTHKSWIASAALYFTYLQDWLKDINCHYLLYIQCFWHHTLIYLPRVSLT